MQEFYDHGQQQQQQQQSPQQQQQQHFVDSIEAWAAVAPAQTPAEQKGTPFVERKKMVTLTEQYLGKWLSFGKKIKKGNQFAAIDGRPLQIDLTRLLLLLSKSIAREKNRLVRSRKIKPCLHFLSISSLFSPSDHFIVERTLLLLLYCCKTEAAQCGKKSRLRNCNVLFRPKKSLFFVKTIFEGKK